MDDFEEQVQRLLQTKSKVEIQRGLADSESGKSVHQYHLAALQRIQAKEFVEATKLAQSRHRESIREHVLSRKIAVVALLLSALALAISIFLLDSAYPTEPEPSPRSPTYPHTESTTGGSTAPTEPDAPEPDQ